MTPEVIETRAAESGGPYGVDRGQFKTVGAGSKPARPRREP